MSTYITRQSTSPMTQVLYRNVLHCSLYIHFISPSLQRWHQGCSILQLTLLYPSVRREAHISIHAPLLTHTINRLLQNLVISSVTSRRTSSTSSQALRHLHHLVTPRRSNLSYPSGFVMASTQSGPFTSRNFCARWAENLECRSARSY